MWVAPPWRTSAAGERAALVPHDEGSADGAADAASFASDVEDLAVAVEDDGEYFSVARPLPHCLRAELDAVVEHASATLRADAVAQLVIVDRDHDLRPIPAILWQLAAFVGQLAHLDQGVGPPLPRGAWIRLVFPGSWGAQRIQRGA